jgi:serine/threonine protein kinase
VSENYLRMYWQQMLEAVQTIHDERIVHADLKPANFMIVEGALKLIDFGLAKAIGNDTTNILRDELVGSLNYISPEAILDCPAGGVEFDASSGSGGNGIGGNNGHKLGRPADVWCVFIRTVGISNCTRSRFFMLFLLRQSGNETPANILDHETARFCECRTAPR